MYILSAIRPQFFCSDCGLGQSVNVYLINNCIIYIQDTEMRIRGTTPSTKPTSGNRGVQATLISTRFGLVPYLLREHVHKKYVKDINQVMIVCSGRNEQSLSELEIEVPEDQRPVNELRQLKNSFLYSWVRGDISQYGKL